MVVAASFGLDEKFSGIKASTDKSAVDPWTQGSGIAG